jgi:hypothetical protein
VVIKSLHRIGKLPGYTPHQTPKEHRSRNKTHNETGHFLFKKDRTGTSRDADILLAQHGIRRNASTLLCGCFTMRPKMVQTPRGNATLQPIQKSSSSEFAVLGNGTLLEPFATDGNPKDFRYMYPQLRESAKEVKVSKHYPGFLLKI